MQSENNVIIDGWIFSSVSGILTTQLGLALTESMNNHSGIRVWGKLDDDNGSTTFKTQSWANFQKVTPNFPFGESSNQIVSIHDALMSSEISSIRVFIIDKRPPENFKRDGETQVHQFIIIGDESETSLLVLMNLNLSTILLEQTYEFTQVRRKIFNSTAILSTTINTNISPSRMAITANLENLDRILGLDLCDKKNVISCIEEFSGINKSNSCSTCKSELKNVEGAATVVFCEKCHRYILKKNINDNSSMSISIHNGEEKVVLWISGAMVENLFKLLFIPTTASETEIAVSLLSNIELKFEYSELRKQVLSVSMA